MIFLIETDQETRKGKGRTRSPIAHVRTFCGYVPKPKARDEQVTSITITVPRSGGQESRMNSTQSQKMELPRGRARFCRPVISPDQHIRAAMKPWSSTGPAVVNLKYLGTAAEVEAAMKGLRVVPYFPRILLRIGAWSNAGDRPTRSIHTESAFTHYTSGVVKCKNAACCDPPQPTAPVVCFSSCHVVPESTKRQLPNCRSHPHALCTRGNSDREEKEKGEDTSRGRTDQDDATRPREV